MELQHKASGSSPRTPSELNMCQVSCKIRQATQTRMRESKSMVHLPMDLTESTVATTYQRTASSSHDNVLYLHDASESRQSMQPLLSPISREGVKRTRSSSFSGLHVSKDSASPPPLDLNASCMQRRGRCLSTGEPQHDWSYTPPKGFHTGDVASFYIDSYRSLVVNAKRTSPGRSRLHSPLRRRENMLHRAGSSIRKAVSPQHQRDALHAKSKVSPRRSISPRWRGLSPLRRGCSPVRALPAIPSGTTSYLSVLPASKKPTPVCIVAAVETMRAMELGKSARALQVQSATQTHDASSTPWSPSKEHTSFIKFHLNNEPPVGLRDAAPRHRKCRSLFSKEALAIEGYGMDYRLVVVNVILVFLVIMRMASQPSWIVMDRLAKHV